ncbi:MAG: bifunctional ornithine acetyltransferase/N-acetylglutamate synthase, partial [Alphaproteobacteria bacterium]
APDMATMLAFLFTDAPLSADVVQALCAAGAQESFNAITVDSDTSTSDTVLLFATGTAAAAGAPEITDAGDERLRPFAAALKEVMLDLAHQIVRDGEGASKFVTVRVEGAANDPAAKRIAFAIANSPLVKTAVAGEDPNWGRVVMAVGKAGEAADRDRLAIWLGPIAVARNGEVHPDYVESEAANYMKGDMITIRVDVGVGKGAATVWTCDLTDRYIAINADYRS